MKSICSKTALVALVMIAAVSLSGCVKDKKVITIMPDGSGKVDFTMAINTKLIEDTLGGMMPQGGESGGGMMDADPTDVGLGDLKENFAGFVAFTTPKIEDGSDGWKNVSFTGYFENINDIRIFNNATEEEHSDEHDEGEFDEMGGEETPAPAEAKRESKASFVFKQTETGYTLEVVTVLQEQNEEMGGSEEADPEMENMVFGMMAAMLKDFEVLMAIGMPGAVTSAEGMTVAGNTATFKIDGGDLKSAEDMKKLSQQKNFKVVCGASQVTAEQVGAFKLEMAEAKMKWEAMLKEAEAAEEHEEHSGEDAADED